jgi:hypothetical protein
MRSTIHLPRIRSARPRRLARWTAPILLGLAAAACGSSSATEVDAGLPPSSAHRAAFAAEARRYIDFQVDRAEEARSDDGFRAASAAEADRYVDLQVARAESVRS